MFAALIYTVTDISQMNIFSLVYQNTDFFTLFLYNEIGYAGMYNITLWLVHVTIVAMEMQQCIVFVLLLTI
jgi:hypothetical protein